MTQSDTSKNEVPLEASIPDGAVSLESILCTEELRRRPSRPPDYEKENRALVALASALADSPHTILQTLAETILDVTQSDSAGVSLLRTDDGGKRFYWPAIAGIWKPHIGGGTPRNFGPCGDALDCNSTLLFRHLERRYTYFLPFTPPAVECLLVPFHVGGKAVGTIWALLHDDRRKYDAEDERLMNTLGQFASLAYQALASIEDLKFQIAEREKAEQGEDHLRLVVDTTPALIHTGRPDGYLDYFNQRWLEYLGLSLDDVCGWRWTKAIHPDDVEDILKKWRAALATGEPFEAETRVRRADGEYRRMLHRKCPLRDSHGKILKWYGSSLDIEDRKQAEARFEGILKIAQDAIISVDSNQRIILFNQGAEKVFGYTQAEVVGGPLDLLLPQRFEDAHRKHVEGFGRSPDVARTMGQRRQVSGRRKDGSEFPAEASISKLDLGGEPVFTVILRDITDRKRAESRLNTQYAITRILSESTSIDEATPRIVQSICECLDWKVGEIWRVDGETRLSTFVKAWHFPSGDFAEFASASLRFTFPPGVGLPGRVCESRKPLWIRNLVEDCNFLRISLATKADLRCGFGFPILLGEETLGAMLFFSRDVREPDHDVLEMMANIGSQIGQFIERKRAEDGLRRSEAYLAEAQELSHTGSFGWNVCSGEIYWSRETFRIFEYEPTAKTTIGLIVERTHPEDRSAVQELIERVSRERTEFGFEHRLLMPDGSVKYLRVVGRPSEDEGGCFEFVGAVTDITERRRADEALRRSEGYLAEAQRLTRTGSWAWDMATRRAIYWSQEHYRIFGFDPEGGIPSDEVFYERIHREDRDRVGRAIFRDREDQGSDYDVDYRIVLPDKTIKYIRSTGHPVFNASGDIVAYFGSAMDVTEQHEARAALETAFEQIKVLKDQLYKENIALREEIDKASMFEEIVGSSEALRKILLQVAKVAPTDSTVLILGETGTGKELIARAIHNRSSRSARAFIRVNCAAIPPSLIASELFGHEKGAFTGALQRRLGRFESADGGTIFLDEVGELPMETQIALLRVLQEREFERVGGSESISLDVRVLAATNRDLGAAVAAGAFRQDLFYRLNVFPIHIPALRDRREDILLLIHYLIERYGKKAGKKIRNIKKETLDLFQAYDWPGNVRELQNVVERAVILCDGETFSVDETWLKRESRPPTGRTVPLVAKLVEREKEEIESALAECQGRISGPSGAAAKLGIPRQTLESKIAKLGIDRYRFKLGKAQNA